MTTKQNIQFKEIYDTHFQTVYKIAMRYTNGNSDDAYDIVQTTFLKCYKKIDQLKDQSKLRSWLFTIAVNEGKEFLRKKQKNRSLLDRAKEWFHIEDQGRFEKETADKLSTQQLLFATKFIDDITNEKTKKIVTLFYKEGKKVREIADELNMNISTITTNLNRFRVRLLSHYITLGEDT